MKVRLKADRPEYSVNRIEIVSFNGGWVAQVFRGQENSSLVSDVLTHGEGITPEVALRHAMESLDIIK